MGASGVDALSHDAMQREFVLGAVRALGIAQARWINDYFRSGTRLKDAELDAYVDRGELLRVPCRRMEERRLRASRSSRRVRPSQHADACAHRTRRCCRRSIP